jgi:hypothetical protein
MSLACEPGGPEPDAFYLTLAPLGARLKSMQHARRTGSELEWGYCGQQVIIYDFHGVEFISRKIVKSLVSQARRLGWLYGLESGQLELRGMAAPVARTARYATRDQWLAAGAGVDGEWLRLGLYPRKQDPTKLSLAQAVVARDGEDCAWCGLALKADDWGVTLDHVIPRSQDGLWEVDNLLLACDRCNSRRGAKSAAKWLGHCRARGLAVKVAVVEAAIARAAELRPELGPAFQADLNASLGVELRTESTTSPAAAIL